MSKYIRLSAALLLLFVLPAFSQEPSPPSVSGGNRFLAIRDYTFQGMTFGTDLKTFQEKYPSALPWAEESDPDNGLQVFLLTDVSGPDQVVLSFYNNQLFRVTLIYSVPTINAMGGWQTLAEKLVAKYGKADGDSLGTDVKGDDEVANYFWRFIPSVNRTIRLRVMTKAAKVEFSDASAYEKWQARKKQNANVGF